MTNITKGLIAFGAVAGIFGVLAFFGATPFLQVNTVVQQLAGASPSGTTLSTAKQASVVVNLGAPGTNATSSSVFNNSQSDYYVTAIKAGCEAVGTSNLPYGSGGLAALTLKVSTSSTAAPAVLANNNLVGAGAMTLATATPTFVEASSTASTALPNAGSSLVTNIWPAQTYMVFTVNATNTALCTFGVDYFSS